jgi:hypothetical protein
MGCFPRNKATGRETDHLPPSVADVMNEWSYTSSMLCAFIAYTGITLSLPLSARLLCKNVNMKIYKGMIVAVLCKGKPWCDALAYRQKVCENRIGLQVIEPEREEIVRG